MTSIFFKWVGEKPPTSFYVGNTAIQCLQEDSSRRTGGDFWLTPDFDASGMSLGTAWWVEDLSAGYGFRIRFLVSWMEFPSQKRGEKQQHILPTCGDFRV